jgi:hypothetical protein
MATHGSRATPVKSSSDRYGPTLPICLGFLILPTTILWHYISNSGKCRHVASHHTSYAVHSVDLSKCRYTILRVSGNAVHAFVLLESRQPEAIFRASTNADTSFGILQSGKRSFCPCGHHPFARPSIHTLTAYIDFPGSPLLAGFLQLRILRHGHHLHSQFQPIPTPYFGIQQSLLPQR